MEKRVYAAPPPFLVLFPCTLTLIILFSCVWYSVNSHTPLIFSYQASSEAGSVLIFSHLCQAPCCCRSLPLPSHPSVLRFARLPSLRRVSATNLPGQLTHSVQCSPFVTNCQRLVAQWCVARWRGEAGKGNGGVGAGRGGGRAPSNGMRLSFNHSPMRTLLQTVHVHVQCSSWKMSTLGRHESELSHLRLSPPVTSQYKCQATYIPNRHKLIWFSTGDDWVAPTTGLPGDGIC